MVVESILTPIKAEEKPYEMILFGIIMVSMSILLALWVFPSYASFAMVTFTVMAVLPFMVKTLKYEEEKNYGLKHKKALYTFLFLFIGFLIAYTLWYLMLPTYVSNSLFSLQINTITEINTPTGAMITGAVTELSNSFGLILMNNLRILGLCIVFSFIFGSGAIFILSWNASILAVGMANAMKIMIKGGNGGTIYFTALTYSLLRFLIHGIPEITGYMLGGLAGGIISFAILDYQKGYTKWIKKSSQALKDAGKIAILAIGVIVFAALIESFVTPLIIKLFI